MNAFFFAFRIFRPPAPATISPGNKQGYMSLTFAFALLSCFFAALASARGDDNNKTLAQSVLSEMGSPPRPSDLEKALNCSKYLKENCYKSGSIDSLLWQSQNLVGNTTLVEIQREMQRSIMAAATATLKDELATLNRISRFAQTRFTPQLIQQKLQGCNAPPELEHIKSTKNTFQEMQKDFGVVVKELSDAATEPAQTDKTFNENKWLERRANGLMLSYVLNERRNRALEKAADEKLEDYQRRAYRLSAYAAEINLAHLATKQPDLIRRDGADAGGKIMRLLYEESKKNGTPKRAQVFAPIEEFYDQTGGVLEGQVSQLTKTFYNTKRNEQYSYFADTTQLGALNDFAKTFSKTKRSEGRMQADEQLSHLLREYHKPDVIYEGDTEQSLLNEILNPQNPPEKGTIERRRRLKQIIVEQLRDNIDQTLNGLSHICRLTRRPCQSFSIYQKMLSLADNQSTLANQKSQNLLERMSCICSEGEKSQLGELAENLTSSAGDYLTVASYFCVAITKFPAFCASVGTIQGGLDKSARLDAALNTFFNRSREGELAALNLVQPQIGAPTDRSQVAFFANWLTDGLLEKIPGGRGPVDKTVVEYAKEEAGAAKSDLIENATSAGATGEEATPSVPAITIGFTVPAQESNDMETRILQAGIGNQLRSNFPAPYEIPLDKFTQEVSSVVCSQLESQAVNPQSLGNIRVNITSSDGSEKKARSIVVDTSKCP